MKRLLSVFYSSGTTVSHGGDMSFLGAGVIHNLSCGRRKVSRLMLRPLKFGGWFPSIQPLQWWGKFPPKAPELWAPPCTFRVLLQTLPPSLAIKRDVTLRECAHSGKGIHWGSWKGPEAGTLSVEKERGFKGVTPAMQLVSDHRWACLSSPCLVDPCSGHKFLGLHFLSAVG